MASNKTSLDPVEVGRQVDEDDNGSCEGYGCGYGEAFERGPEGK
jgi:hypothetical protein